MASLHIDTNGCKTKVERQSKNWAIYIDFDKPVSDTDAAKYISQYIHEHGLSADNLDVDDGFKTSYTYSYKKVPDTGYFYGSDVTVVSGDMTKIVSTDSKSNPSEVSNAGNN